MKGLIVVLIAAGGIGATMAIIQLVWTRMREKVRRQRVHEATWKSFTDVRDDGKLIVGVKKSYGAGVDEVVLRRLTLQTLDPGDLIEQSKAVLLADEQADQLNALRDQP